jgi:hypothetical protein
MTKKPLKIKIMKVKNLFLALVASALLSCETEKVNDVNSNNLVSTNKNSPSTSKTALASNDVLLTLNGSPTFEQVPWSVNYIIAGESTPIPGDHTLTTPNPILSEMTKYSNYASNVPLSLAVTNPAVGDWYQQYTYTFTNRSNKTFHLDSGVIMFIAPKNSNADREYGNTSHHDGGPHQHGHPQQDYVEVPIAGTPNSWYIARLVFHDVPEIGRDITPGSTWFYRIGVPTNPFSNPGWITTAQSAKTVRFIADLTGNKNEDMVIKYGTKRFRN